VDNQSANRKTAANLFYCYVIGCSQQQHSFCARPWDFLWAMAIIEDQLNAAHKEAADAYHTERLPKHESTQLDMFLQTFVM